MKNSKVDKKILDSIMKMFDEGSTRNEISGFIFSKTEDFNSVQRYINEMKKVDERFQFRKESSNWDCIIDYFQNCKDNQIEVSKDDLKKKLEEELEMKDSQSKKYISSYFYVLNEIYKI